jgi:phosphopentomutase
MARRAFVVVIDAAGAGALPDTVAYGDPADADTLVHIAEAVGGLRLPTLQALGLGCIRPILGVPPASAPVLHGRLAPQGPGKESTTGHWELMGVVAPAPLPVYPDGFPPAVLAALNAVTGGSGFLCNAPYPGTEVIRDFGSQHLRTGALILYTSADSVLQVAAHHDVLSEAALRELCARMRRDVMVGPHAVGRVIARPFAGPPGAFERTEGRKDFALRPPGRSYLDELSERGVPVHAVGKTHDLFAGVGFTHAHPGAGNARALAETTVLVDGLAHGLVFTNLIETDQLFGHRKDPVGFHAALRRIDEEVAGWLERLGPDDLLVLTADHGVDPTAPHTDHTREHVPLLARFTGDAGREHHGPFADVGASVHAWLTGAEARGLPGRSFV